MFKMHSQQPKRAYYNVYSKIGRDLQTHGRVLSLNGCFWSKMAISSHSAAVEYIKPFKF